MSDSVFGLHAWLGNDVLTRKNDGTKHRNAVYKTKTYIADTGHACDPYYVGPFRISGDPINGEVWTHGRFKGYKDRTPITMGIASAFVEPLIIPQWYVDACQRRAGTGGKSRYVQSASGYIWLPDNFRFHGPMFILECAMNWERKKIYPVHAEKPFPPTWPAWEPGADFCVVDETTGPRSR